MTMGVYTGALLSLLIPGAGKFKVTPKMGTDEGGLSTLHRLRLLTTCAGALCVAMVCRAAASAGLFELPAMPRLALIGSLVIGMVELTVIGLVFRALIGRRQRRVIYRFPVDVRATVDDELVRVADLNHHGAGLLFSHPPDVGTSLGLTLRLPALDGTVQRVAVSGVVRAIVPTSEPDVLHVGVQFTDLSTDAENRILEYCHVLRPASVAADGALAQSTPAVQTTPALPTASLIPTGPATPTGRVTPVAPRADASNQVA
jgi:hypothetical protein